MILPRVEAHVARCLVVIVLLLPVGMAGAAPVSAMGPPVPLADPVGGYSGRITLSPGSGPAGTSITVTAEDLPPKELFQLVWGTVTGRWKVANGEYGGRSYEPVGYLVAEIKSDSEGRLSTSFEAPEDFGFSHDVVLQQGKRLFTKAAFDLDMTVEITPERGPAGTPIEVEVKGIGWRQLENSWLLLYDNSFTGWMSAVTTVGTARFSIPATGSPGTHVLEVLHGDFTFPYRNMQQSPAPDRPRFVRHFTITEGEPVLPLAADQQKQRTVRDLPPAGRLVAEPAFTTVGEPLTVRATGLQPGLKLALTWKSVSGNRVAGSGWQEWTRVVADATVDATGTAEFSFDTPDDLGAAHELSIEHASGTLTGIHWIAPSAVPLDVSRGPAGTPFTVHLKGVGWTETANIYTVVYDNKYIGYACGFSSQGDVAIELYASGEPGVHFIDLYPAIYKGKESRPINFRLPQLTYAADHPGEDLPRFRFSFEVTEEKARLMD
jgi:hypothetical protein